MSEKAKTWIAVAVIIVIGYSLIRGGFALGNKLSEKD